MRDILLGKRIKQKPVVLKIRKGRVFTKIQMFSGNLKAHGHMAVAIFESVQREKREHSCTDRYESDTEGWYSGHAGSMCPLRHIGEFH